MFLDVVHAVSYSMLLLNTDLHVVDQSTSSKMTRNQFVRNTLNAISEQTGIDEASTGGGEVFSPTMNTSNEIGEGGGGGGSRNNLNDSPSISTGKSSSTSRPTTATGLGLSQRSESVLTVGSTGSQKSLEANLQLVLKVRDEKTHFSLSLSLCVSLYSVKLNRCDDF